MLLWLSWSAESSLQTFYRALNYLIRVSAKLPVEVAMLKCVETTFKSHRVIRAVMETRGDAKGGKPITTSEHRLDEISLRLHFWPGS